MTSKTDALNKIQIKGVASYPKLDRPYKYDAIKKKSLPDPEGEYSVSLIVDAKEAKAYIKAIDECAKAAGVSPAKARNMPYAPELDKETEEETGRYIFRCKGYGTRRDGSANRIPHWSASGNPMKADYRLGGGSLIRVELWAKPFKELGGGVRLNLNAIQVLKHVAAQDTPNPFGRDEEYAGNDDELSAGEANVETIEDDDNEVSANGKNEKEPEDQDF